MLADAPSLFRQLQQFWPDQSMFRTLDFLNLSPDIEESILHMVQSVPRWTCEQVSHVHVYVDGSSFDSCNSESPISSAAWAFVVVLDCPHATTCSTRFFGASFHALSAASTPDSLFYGVGEVLHDALSAEAAGMIVALCWCAQCPFDADITVHYDNQTVGGFASGGQRWTCSWEYQTLKDNLAALRNCHGLLKRSLDFEHQKSHVGHPWSEVVDCTAKLAAKGILFGLPIPVVISKIMNHSSFKMAWMGLLDSRTMPTPAALPGTFQAEGPFGKHQPDTTWHRPMIDSGPQEVQIHLSFATANAASCMTSRTEATPGLPLLDGGMGQTGWSGGLLLVHRYSRVGDLGRSRPSRSCVDKGGAAARPPIGGGWARTFTEARHHELPPLCPRTGKIRKWPRPLRSHRALLGLEGLELRELKQLKVGSAFAMQMMETVARQIRGGGLSIYEHPAPPDDESRASIWTSPMALTLRQLPATQLAILPQWRWGAASTKPTGFLHTRLPHFCRSMWSRAPPDIPYPARESIGLQADGTFATGALKEYPAQLCRALAFALGDQLTVDLRQGRARLIAQPPPELTEWVSELSAVSAQVHAGAVMRADYQGG
eukprot:Skav231894  [mRNA]  locus=scaffold960:47823:50796:+ [translate_table: standard]